MSLDTFPTEILMKIFLGMPPRYLINCRLVSLRWKTIIDKILQDDERWYRMCVDKFRSIFRHVRLIALDNLSWRQTCKSLYLWSQLEKAHEKIIVWKTSQLKGKRMKNIAILENGIVGIHTKHSVIYLNVYTLQYCLISHPVYGIYSTYMENIDCIALINPYKHLFVTPKFGDNKREPFSFDNVDILLLVEKFVYFVEKERKVHVLNLNIMMTHCLGYFPQCIVAIGFTDYLNVLTHDRQICSFVRDECICFDLEPHDDILHELWKYDLLRQMDWNIYRQWMCNSSYILTKSVDVCRVRAYENIVFVAKLYGVLEIYYKPFTNGKFDLWNYVPIKRYGFAGVHSISDPIQIMNIDVVEKRNGHILLVCLKSKIISIFYNHNLDL